jgi:hypothetical protein
MKRIEYKAPEMEIIEFKVRADVMLAGSPGTGNTGGLSGEISPDL